MSIVTLSKFDKLGVFKYENVERQISQEVEKEIILWCLCINFILILDPDFLKDLASLIVVRPKHKVGEDDGHFLLFDI